MAKARYVDSTSVIQVIGNIYNNPNLLDEDGKYFFTKEDFIEDFHKVLFESIYNLFQLGVNKIDSISIEDYLRQRPKALAVYQTNKGTEYLEQLSLATQVNAFDYYYNRMKKMTLLRMYNEKCGMDLSYIYDINNIMDIKKKQLQEDWLDNSSLEEIADLIDKKITDIRLTYVNNAESHTNQAGAGLRNLLNKFKEVPEVGIPLYGPLINTITRGARLKKVYLRSAPSGVGKTRSLIADACNFASPELFNPKTGEWESNGAPEPTLYITTEQELSEVQTMIVAFISAVDEDHILTGRYEDGEWARVTKATSIIEEMPLEIAELPDFSLQDIENTIKQSIREHQTRYVLHDYIHTSMKILSEISGKASIKGLREDNILFMISVRLKDIANQYGVFIETATQLNGQYKEAEVYDQNLLRGAKAIADKIDFGSIMLNVDQEDLESLKDILSKGNFECPNMKIAIYKNRRGRYVNMLLWAKANKGTCRIEPMFATDYQYELIEVPELKIHVKKPDISAF